MCDNWKNSFPAFYEWAIKNGYVAILTIDRIDVDKGYYPENCRWITRKDQCNNTRRNQIVSINGETKTLAQWSDETGINPKTIFARYAKGNTGQKLIRPVETKFRHKKKILPKVN